MTVRWLGRGAQASYYLKNRLLNGTYWTALFVWLVLLVAVTKLLPSEEQALVTDNTKLEQSTILVNTARGLLIPGNANRRGWLSTVDLLASACSIALL
jgi:hypothetical protein